MTLAFVSKFMFMSASQKKWFFIFLHIFFVVVVFAATDVFMDLNTAPTPLPLYYWAHCRKPWGQKQSGACLHMIPTYKYETCTNWIVFSRLPQKLIASFCHITPSLAALPGVLLQDHQAISACVCVCVRERLSYSKQDSMFTCAISEEFSSIADVGRIQTPEANADLHGGSTPTLRPSHTGSFSVSSPHQPVGNSFL